MAMDYVPGVGMVDRATGQPLFSAPGAEPTLHETQTENYLARKKAFEDETHWKYDREYDWRSLYGSVNPDGTYIPSFGSGMNDSWGAALGDRLIRREQGQLDGLGHFESKLGTSAEDYQRRIYARNNAIEDMYRRGYSMNQIDSFLKGEVDMEDFQPDWKDYKKAYREASSTGNPLEDAGILISGGTVDKPDVAFWGDDYFIGKPTSTTIENPLGGMMGEPGEATSGSFMDAYRTKRGMLEGEKAAASAGSLTERAARNRTKFDKDKFASVKERFAGRDSIASLFKEMKEFKGE